MSRKALRHPFVLPFYPFRPFRNGHFVIFGLVSIPLASFLGHLDRIRSDRSCLICQVFIPQSACSASLAGRSVRAESRAVFGVPGAVAADSGAAVLAASNLGNEWERDAFRRLDHSDFLNLALSTSAKCRQPSGPSPSPGSTSLSSMCSSNWRWSSSVHTSSID